MSKRFSLNKQDGVKILIGAGVAALGAILTYGTEVIAQIDFGAYTPVVVALWGIIVNTARKFLSESK